MSNRKLVYQSLGEQAVTALTDYIVEEGLRPGQRLPGESALAERFGVSRPVIREALKTLAGMGVVEIAKGKSPVVLPMTSEPLLIYFVRATRMEQRTIADLVEVRRGIEIEAASLAAERHTAENISELRTILVEMREAIGDTVPYADADVRFHVAVAAATGNRMLRLLVESTRDALQATINEGLRRRATMAQLERVQEDHEDLLRAIESGSAEAARRAMTVHFDEAALAIFGSELARDATPGRPGRNTRLSSPSE